MTAAGGRELIVGRESVREVESMPTKAAYGGRAGAASDVAAAPVPVTVTDVVVSETENLAGLKISKGFTSTGGCSSMGDLWALVVVGAIVVAVVLPLALVVVPLLVAVMLFWECFFSNCFSVRTRS